MNKQSLAKILEKVLFTVLGATSLTSAGCASSVVPLYATDVQTPVDTPVPTDTSDISDTPIPPVDEGQCTPVPDTSNFCFSTLTWPCNRPSDITEQGTQSLQVCERYCPMITPSRAWQCSTATTGTSTVLNCTYCIQGRRTSVDFAPSIARTSHDVCNYLAESAALEYLSITAFERIHRELSQLGCPNEILTDILQAKQDEVVHTQLVRDACMAYGYPGDLRFDALNGTQERSVFEIAEENLVEGCLRETLGAMIALWQASHTNDPALAAMYHTISQDEIFHASISWNIHHWITNLLSEEEKKKLTVARDDVYQRLLRDTQQNVSDDLVNVAGFPTALQLHSMVEQLEKELWSSSLPSDNNRPSC